jgi:hypothetical protein
MITTLRLERETTGFQIRDWPLRARAAISRTVCVLMGGHWRVLHTSRDRMALKCVGCGDTTPGWQVGPASRRKVAD